MENALTYIMVYAIVKKAIREMKSDPERSVRNLVDMAQQFSESRFQQNLYSAAQKLLDNEDSHYYSLIKDTITRVDEEILLTFGMNLGYNGLFEGAAKIRETEKREGYHIPWAIAMDISEEGVFEEHDHVIEQGEQMGIHSWSLISANSTRSCMQFAKRHPNSAFVIFCGTNKECMNALNYGASAPNTAIMVPFDKEADATCSALRDAGKLYGLYYFYSAQDINAIESGELLHEMEQLHPCFSVLKPKTLAEQEVRSRAHKWITAARLDHQFKTIPWELYGDAILIDQLISGHAIWVGFDRFGQLKTDQGVDRTYGRNIFTHDLPTVLRWAFPTQQKMCCDGCERLSP